MIDKYVIYDAILKKQYGHGVIEEYGMTPEELTEQENNYIMSKGDSDFEYDPQFSVFLGERYFWGNLLPSTDAFIIATTKINTLYRYYEYVRRYINYYIEETNVQTNLLKPIIQDAPFLNTLNANQKDDTEELPKYTRIMILTILYSYYEMILKSVVKTVQKEFTVYFDPYKYKGDRKSVSDQYLLFLENEFGMDLSLLDEVKGDIDTIRIIRNYFVHEGEFDVTHQIEKIRRLAPEIVVDNKVVPTHEFIMDSFNTIGIAMQIIQLSYIKRVEEIDKQ